MAFLDWTDDLSVGIGEIDAEHRELISMLNDLHGAMSRGEGKAALSTVLDRLVKYTQSHFSHEEELMRKHGYTDAWKHTNEHRELTRQVIEVKDKFDSGKTLGLPIEVLNFLRDWLGSHIKSVDARFGNFLKTKGVH